MTMYKIRTHKSNQEEISQFVYETTYRQIPQVANLPYKYNYHIWEVTY